MSWLSTLTAEGTVHCVPLDDVIVHEFAEDCSCGPTTVPADMPGGRVGWLMVHHSLDGREAVE